MRSIVRSTAAALTAFAWLGLAGASRAELVTVKPKRAFVAQETSSAIADVDGNTLFQEAIELKKEPSCVLVRFSGELIGTDGDGDGIVGVNFDVSIGDIEVQQPELHDAVSRILPQIVSFSGLACGVPPGKHVVNVDFRVTDPEDSAAMLNRTLEIWVEKGKALPPVA